MLYINSFLQIFFPLINDQHWTVYCINKVHNQIDILDPQDWPTQNDKNEHHLKMAPKFRQRLSFAFQMFAGTSFPDISLWTMRYVDLPLQNPKNDCVFFCTLYLEFYDGINREIVKECAIDKVSQAFHVSCQALHVRCHIFLFLSGIFMFDVRHFSCSMSYIYLFMLGMIMYSYF